MDKENYNIPEELDEWQQISPPSSMDDKAHWMSNDTTLVIKEDFFNGCSSSSSSPPIHHQNSPVTTSQGTQIPEASSSSSSSSSSSLLGGNDSDAEGAEEAEAEAAVGVVKSEICRWRRIFAGVARLMKNYVACRVRLWSSVFATAGVLSMVVMSLWCVRVQRWRKRAQMEKIEHLMLLLKDREQRISQLLLQISDMNEMLSARQKVPVLRVA